MSFSSKVKEELGRQISPARHCQIAEFAAIFFLCGKIRMAAGEKIFAEIRTENLTVAKKSFILIKMAFNADIEIRIQNHRLKPYVPVYFLVLRDSDMVRKILKSVKLLNESGDRWGDSSGVPYRLVQNTCCRQAYLRSVFMIAGSVTNPEKAYHLEITVASRKFCEQLQELLSSFDIEAKITSRKKYYVLYVKEGSAIVDFLGLIGAHLALMDFENVRILKDVRNAVNRQVNCETANISKVVTAAARQIEDIRYIERLRGFSHLSDGLQEIAELRLDYPESSLAELGQMLSKPLGKSGVNHRLRKLSEIAERMREEQGGIPDPKEDRSHDFKEN